MKVQSILTAASLALIFAACGKKAKDVNKNSSLRLPTYQTDGTLDLSDGSGDHQFQGSVMFWNPSVSADEASTMMRISGATDRANVASLRFQNEYLYPVRTELGKKKARLAALLANGDQAAAPKRREVAAAWVTNQQQALGLSESQNAHFADVWQKYCEAKVVQTAVSPALVSLTFKERPTPAAMCEKVYEQGNLFSHSACTPGAQQNYFTCLWNAAAKTSFMKELYTAESAQAIAALAEDPAFVTALKEDDGSIANAILNADLVPNPDSPYMMRFAVTATPSGAAKNSSLATSSAGQVLDLMEENPDKLAELEELRPACESDRQSFRCLEWVDPNEYRLVSAVDGSAAQQAQATEILSAIKKMNATVARDGEQIPSANDIVFNFPISVPERARPANWSAESLPVDISVQEPDSTNAEEIAQLQQEVAALAEKLKAVLGRLSIPETGCTDVKEHIGCTVMEWTLKKLNYAAQPSISRAIFPRSMLSIKSKGSDVTTVRFQLATEAGIQVAQACLKSGAQVACEQMGDAKPMSVNQDPETKMIQLTIPLGESPERWGFVELKRKFDPKTGLIATPMFNEIPASSLKNKFLFIEFAHNKMEGFAPFVSGSAAIVDEAQNVLEIGAASSFHDLLFQKFVSGEVVAQ